MRIDNVEVFGLASSIYRSGYSMIDRAPTKEEFELNVHQITEDALLFSTPLNNGHVKRAIKLSNASGGGHDQFMTGIVVNFDLTFSNKAWVEAERYTFLNFISSMSTMHRISKFDIENMCNEFVKPEAIKVAEDCRVVYNNLIEKEAPEDVIRGAYLSLLYNLPSGFELMAGMTTNYRCLKNILTQRRNHRLPDWQYFCDWIETLPLAPELLIKSV